MIETATADSQVAAESNPAESQRQSATLVKRDAHGHFLPGVSGNAKGPPKGIYALQRAVREQIGADEMVRLAVEKLRSGKLAARDWVSLWSALARAGWAAPTTHVELSTTAANSLPSNWSSLSVAERSAYLDARLALGAGGDDR
jgi:hypothetical protein